MAHLNTVVCLEILTGSPGRVENERGAGPAFDAEVRREALSYDVSHSHVLWYTDFHHGKRREVTASVE